MVPQKKNNISKISIKYRKIPKITQKRRNHELIAEPFHGIRDRWMAVSCHKINEISQISTKYRKITQKRRNHELIAGRCRSTVGSDGLLEPFFKATFGKQHTKFPSTSMTSIRLNIFGTKRTDFQEGIFLLSKYSRSFRKICIMKFFDCGTKIV